MQFENWGKDAEIGESTSILRKAEKNKKMPGEDERSEQHQTKQEYCKYVFWLVFVSLTPALPLFYSFDGFVFVERISQL